jgi:hypothetical protein
VKRQLVLAGALSLAAISAVTAVSFPGAFALTSAGPAAVAPQPAPVSASQPARAGAPQPVRADVPDQSAAAKPAPSPSISGGIAVFHDTVGLAALATACAATASPTQAAGAVVLEGGLKDEHATVTFAVPCAVQLPGAASVKLNNVTVQSQSLNFSDTAFAAGDNTIQFSNVTFTGGGDAGFLVELTDPGDHVKIETATVTYPMGIVIQLQGGRTEPDSGGAVELHHSTLVSQGADSAGITIGASTHQGSISANNSTFLADQIALVADQCSVFATPQPVDCRASTLGDDLKTQATTG